MVFRFLAVVIFGLLLLNGVRLLFDDQSRPETKAEVRPDIRTSSTSNLKDQIPSPSPSPKQNFERRPQKVSMRGEKANESESASISTLKLRLQQSGALGLARVVWFEPQPLEQGADTQSLGLAKSKLQHVPTGVNRDSQRTPKERI